MDNSNPWLQVEKFSEVLQEHTICLKLLQEAVIVSNTKVDKIYNTIIGIQEDLHQHSIEDIRIQTGLETKLEQLQKDIDRQEARNEQYNARLLPTMLQSIGIGISFLTGTTALLFQLFKK